MTIDRGDLPGGCRSNFCDPAENQTADHTHYEPVTPAQDSRSPIAKPARRCRSLLNDHLYRPRRAALKLVEGWREENQHTARGEIIHEHADLAGYETLRESEDSNFKSQIILWRALPVWSARLGLSGKCDIVEVQLRSPAPDRKFEISDFRPDHLAGLKPVEYKVGKRRQWDNDDAQVCAQALCLEVMFGLPIPGGANFHADSKRRREVVFTPELRVRTEAAIAELRSLLRESEIQDLKSEVPSLLPAVWRPACAECSCSTSACPGRSAAKFARRLAACCLKLAM